MKHPDYGIDSPGIVMGLTVAGAIGFLLASLFPHIFGHNVRWLEILIGGYFLVGALGMLSYSLSGKVRLRDEILASIPWRGDESVLDIGCGRGLYVVGAARRLRTGRAIGADLWVPGAISGNRPGAVLENAAAQGVADRVRVAGADARQLPFADESFDVVLSNYLIHEVNTADERRQILCEIARVLKPGGRVAIVDFIFTSECVSVLQSAGIPDARRDRLGGISFWSIAIMFLGSTQTHLVSGRKVNAFAA